MKKFDGWKDRVFPFEALAEAQEFQSRIDGIKSEIKSVLQKHNLTLGQSLAILSECKSDWSATAFQMRSW